MKPVAVIPASTPQRWPRMTALPAAELDAPRPAEQPRPNQAPTAPSIHVSTDVFDLEISTQGGTLQSAILLAYPVAKDQPDKLVQLLSTDDANFGLIQTGLRFLGEGDEANHLATFTSDRRSYEMGSAAELEVSLWWENDLGILAEKRCLFKRGEYACGIVQEVSNMSDGLWRGANYAQLLRFSKDQERSMFDVDSYSFNGPIIYTGEKSEKLQRDDLMEDGAFKFKSQAGWFGAIQHHFLSAVIPERGTDQTYSVSVRGARSIASTIGQPQTIAPGASKTFTTTVFIGPKRQAQLEKIDESLKLTVDYGWLTIISQPLFWLLRTVFGFVGNWGVAIILVTFLIKAAFYKLTESSGRSMAKMRSLQPRMKALQERYKDDRPALSQATMELYKR